MPDDYQQRIQERSVVKADPGWAVAIYIKPGKHYEGHVSYDPIIAWAITYEEGPHDPHLSPKAFRARKRWHHRSVEPITYEHGDLTHYGGFWGVKRPDGTIFAADVYCKDEADFIEVAKQVIAAEAQKSKAAS